MAVIWLDLQETGSQGVEGLAAAWQDDLEHLHLRHHDVRVPRPSERSICISCQLTMHSLVVDSGNLELSQRIGADNDALRGDLITHQDKLLKRSELKIDHASTGARKSGSLFNGPAPTKVS